MLVGGRYGFNIQKLILGSVAMRALKGRFRKGMRVSARGGRR